MSIFSRTPTVAKATDMLAAAEVAAKNAAEQFTDDPNESTGLASMVASGKLAKARKALADAQAAAAAQHRQDLVDERARLLAGIESDVDPAVKALVAARIVLLEAHGAFDLKVREKSADAHRINALDLELNGPAEGPDFDQYVDSFASLVRNRTRGQIEAALAKREWKEHEYARAYAVATSGL